MKRELKVRTNFSSLPILEGFRRCPYEEGTESFNTTSLEDFLKAVSDAVPMKRELKAIGRTLSKVLSQVSDAVPMKRELKVKTLLISSTVSVVSDAVPMKRELKGR